MEIKMPINLEIKTDITDSTNKIIDNALEKPTKESGKALGTILEFFNNTILYPMQKYNLYANNKLNKFAEQLEDKASKIPKKKITAPSINILGGAIEGLKYNLDEEHIKNMFLNILISDINIDKKTDVLPSFIEIVKQLSNEDAIFLKKLYNIYKTTNSKSFVLIMMILKNPNNPSFFVDLDKYIVSSENNIMRTIKINPIILDNLMRLGIINIKQGHTIAGTKLYDTGFDTLKRNYSKEENISCNRGILNITDFGMRFLKICIDT